MIYRLGINNCNVLEDSKRNRHRGEFYFFSYFVFLFSSLDFHFFLHDAAFIDTLTPPTPGT